MTGYGLMPRRRVQFQIVGDETVHRGFVLLICHPEGSCLKGPQNANGPTARLGILRPKRVQDDTGFTRAPTIGNCTPRGSGGMTRAYTHCIQKRGEAG
jgi:hypothetical protein